VTVTNLISKWPLKVSLTGTVHLDGVIVHSHSQRPVLRVFLLDKSIRYFYFKLTN